MESITSKDNNLPIGEKTLSQAEQKQTIIQKLKTSPFIKSPQHIREAVTQMRGNKGFSAFGFGAAAILTGGAIAFLSLSAILGIVTTAVLVPTFGALALMFIAMGILILMASERGTVDDAEVVLKQHYEQEWKSQSNWESTSYNDFIKEKHPEATMMGWDKIDIVKFAEEFTLLQLKALENEVDRLEKIQK